MLNLAGRVEGSVTGFMGEGYSVNCIQYLIFFKFKNIKYSRRRRQQSPKNQYCMMSDIPDEICYLRYLVWTRLNWKPD